MGKPSRHRAPDDEASSRRRVVACGKVYLPPATASNRGAVFHRASAFAIARRHRLAAASSARTGLQARTGAAAASRNLPCAQSFPPKLLKPQRKLLPAPRGVDVTGESLAEGRPSAMES